MPVGRRHTDARKRLRPPCLDIQRHRVGEVVLEKLRRLFETLDVILLHAATLTTRLRKAGVHPRVLSDILGHSMVNLAMETYDRSDADDVATALLPKDWVTLTNNRSSLPINPPFILKKMVSAEGIEPTTY